MAASAVVFEKSRHFEVCATKTESEDRSVQDKTRRMRNIPYTSVENAIPGRKELEVSSSSVQPC
jgi:hypothetical protein